MSEYPKTVGVVTVDTRGGGVFSITHEAIVQPITVRGAAKADTLAEQISAQIVAGLPPQVISSDDGDAEGEDGASQELTAQLAEAALATRSAQQTELEALLARVEELRAAGVTVVMPQSQIDAVDGHNQRIAAAPSEYRSKMSDAQIDALSNIGIKTKRIVLDQVDDIPPTGLFVSHNGRSYMIIPGVEVDVPDFLVGILDDAVITQAITDPETHRTIGHRNRLRFPYRLVR